MTSALTNSNFKINNAILKSNSSSGEGNIAQKEEAGAAGINKKYASNILIADQSDTSLIGQLR